MAETEALDREEIVLAKRLGRLSDAAADAALSDLEARRVANSRRVARVSNEAERLEALKLSDDEVRELTVGVLNVRPGDVDDATGSDLWAQALSLLRGDAEGVIDDSYAELSTWAVEWLSKMTDRFDVPVYLEAGDGAEFTLQATGDEALMLGETGKYLRQADIKGRTGSA